MDGGAWWAAVHGVAQSQTRLKRLSSSSSAGCVIDLFSKYLLAGPVQVSGESLSSRNTWCPGELTHLSQSL